MIKNNIKIGIIVADVDEFLPLVQYIEKGEYEKTQIFGRTAYIFSIKGSSKSAQVFAVNCGIGKVNAAVCATALINLGCSAIFNFGLSGGIGEVKRGCYIVPNRFIEHDFDLTGIGYKPCEKPAQEYIYTADSTLKKILFKIIGQGIEGTAVTGDHFVCTTKESNYLKENFGAVCCDMETAAICYTCNVSNVPFVALRRVSDNADENAVDNYREMNSDVTSMPYMIIIKAIELLLNSDFRS